MVGFGDVLVAEQDTPDKDGPARECLDEFGLPVSLHTGDTYDLAGPDGEVDVREAGLVPVPRVDTDSSLRPTSGRISTVPCLGRRKFAADHELRQFSGGDLRRLGVRHRSRVPHHSDLVGHGQNLVEFVEMRSPSALAGQPAQVLEQLVHFLRNQNRGRSSMISTLAPR